MRRASESDRQAFDELASFIASGSGLRILRTLEMLAALAMEPGRAPASRAAAPSAAALSAAAAVPSSRADLERSPLRSPGARRRLVLIGESAAAGFLLAPDLTPALALRGVLERHARERWEVVDLAAVDLSATDLIAAARRASELRPDVVVVYAGNNWPVRMRLAPPPGHLGPAEQALAFRADAVAGLRRLADEASARVARQTISAVLRILRGAGAVPLVVIPEVDLRGWCRARPVPWLSGDGVRAWHQARQTAVDGLVSREPASALEAIALMRALDGGHCPTTHRLLSTALHELGRHGEARQAARDEVDARAWDNEPTVPGATSVVQNVLREVAVHDGALLVDLPALFEGEPAEPPLFLDYCHLSPAGIALLAGAAVHKVLALDESPPDPATLGATAREISALPAAREGRALFLAGLYTAHWSEGAGGETRDPAMERLSAAMKIDHSLREAIREWTLTRFAPREATLFSTAMQGLGVGLLTGLDPLWNLPGLDPDGLVRLTTLDDALGAFVTAGLLGSAHDASRFEVDLLDSAYLWGAPAERAARRFFGWGSHAFRRLIWPSADFALVADGQADVAVETTLRLPGSQGESRETSALPGEALPEVRLSINGNTVAAIPAGRRWRRTTIVIPAATLRPGLNRLSLAFPIPADGDAARARLSEALDLGIGAEVHPTYGEVFRLTAHPASQRGAGDSETVG